MTCVGSLADLFGRCDAGFLQTLSTAQNAGYTPTASSHCCSACVPTRVPFDSGVCSWVEVKSLHVFYSNNSRERVEEVDLLDDSLSSCLLLGPVN